MNRESLGIELARRAPPWQPRGMAIVCFAAASVLVYTTAFPVEENVDAGKQLGDAAITLAGGIVYWTLARIFRVWMVHLIVILGLTWGLIALSETGSSLGAALALTTLLWTGVFIGAAFHPVVARAYSVFLCVGIAVAMKANGIEGGAAVGMAFAGSFVVIMEILSRATSQLRREATTDSLTGLLNRTGLEREVKRVRSFGRDDRIAVLVADLDGLKKVNDRHGHKAGDRLIREFADSWRQGTRSGDLVARIGGDEFVVVFPEVEEDAAQATVNRLREASPTPWSGGLVIADHGESLESCIERADRLLYSEKADKRGPARGHAIPSTDSQPATSRAKRSKVSR